jgi:hypothetical protein
VRSRTGWRRRDEHLHEVRPEIEERHATSPATARASNVFAGAGRPYSSTPLGIFAPTVRNFHGEELP